MDPIIDPETALPGSGPGTGQPAGTPPANQPGQGGAGTPPPSADPNAELDENGKPLPFDKHPLWKSARSTEKKVQELMSTLGIEDMDELSILLETGKAVSGRLDPEDLDALIEDATTLRGYQQVWSEEAEARKRASEQPDETTERLAAENKKLRDHLSGVEALEHNKKTVKAYEGVVSAAIKEMLPDLDPEDRQFVLMVLGVGNPAIEADIGNKAAVIKGIKDMVRRFSKFNDRKLQKYLEGKEKIPHVPGGGGAGIPAPETGKIKNLKDARQRLAEILGAARG